MKACVIQPKYSTNYEESDLYNKMYLDLMDKCDSSMDIIVLPESSDIPCLAKTKEQSEKSALKYNKIILDKAKETAKRCNAIVFVNARSYHEKGIRNTTYAIDRNGNIAGMYYKKHLVPSEVSELKLDSEYTFNYSKPKVIEIEGIRFSFLTCYDFYFYEEFSAIARENVDVIIGCSHQRSDTHLALNIITQFLAYNTNAYVLRSSVSMDENSTIGGGSMIVAPTGEILTNMESRVGLDTAEIDVKKKYYKPAGYGNPPKAHYEYIEMGRRPWNYRPAGSFIVKPDNIMPYPRICAHRGFNTVAPENSMAAFGAAIAMGAEEIEFDLWPTSDGEIVSIHDAVLERVSNGKGYVYEHSLEELRKLDFGYKSGEKFKGIKIPLFEDILKKFSCQTIMNIHLKTVDNFVPFDEKALKKIVDLIKEYNCENHCYFMTGSKVVLKQLQDLYPEIPRVAGAGEEPELLVEKALLFGCKKIQLMKPYISREYIKRAHDNGLKCNVFWSDDVNEAKEFLNMGVDTILTNDYNLISQIIKK